MVDPVLNPGFTGEPAASGGGEAVRGAPASQPVQVFDDPKQRWKRYPIMALERLPLPFLLVIVLVAALGLGEQVLEYTIETQTAQKQAQSLPFTRLLVFPLLLIYILGNFYILKKTAVTALSKLRDVVLVSDEEFDDHARKIIAADSRVEFLLLLVSMVVVILIFVVMDFELLNTNHGLPSSIPQSIYILVMYTLLGWLLLAIAYNSIRQARALDSLARLPLEINVFDITNLLPFGHLGLIQSLPIVGIVLVPLIIFGAPTRGGYIVIFLSIISFLSLFVPLWGVHNQIDQAQEKALLDIHKQVQTIQHNTLKGFDIEASALAAYHNRLSILMNLRKTVMETPTWPFKDTATVARAILAVTSPLVYFILNELIRTFLFPILSGGN